MSEKLFGLSSITDNDHEQFMSVLADLKVDASCLLEARINAQNETIIHYVCQRDNIFLAKFLLNYKLFEALINFKQEERRVLNKCEFGKFLYAESTSGENALYQCLTRLDAEANNKALGDIVKLFLKSDLIRDINMYINDRPGYKTTILHLLVEREQLELLKFFFDIWEYGDDEYDPLDFTKRDFLAKTPLQIALDTGNQKLARLIYKKTKAYLNYSGNLIDSKSKDYLQLLSDEYEAPLAKIMLQNKVTIASELNGSLKLCDAHYVREVDAQSFETVWAEYLRLANDFDIVIGKHDCGSSNDFSKQMFINRVNKKLSDQHTLVTLILLNYTEFYNQLSDFFRFLPFNFKIVLLFKGNEPPKFNFFIKQYCIAQFDDIPALVFGDVFGQRHRQREHVRNKEIFDTMNTKCFLKFKLFDSTLDLVRTVNSGFSDFAEIIIKAAQTKTHSLEDRAFSKYLLGIAYSESDNMDKKRQAIECYNESINLFRDFYKEEASVSIARALNNIGLVYEDLGNEREALVWYKKSLDMFELLYKRDHDDLYMVLNNIGTCVPPGSKLLFSIQLDYLIKAYRLRRRSDIANHNMSIAMGQEHRKNKHSKLFFF